MSVFDQGDISLPRLTERMKKKLAAINAKPIAEISAFLDDVLHSAQQGRVPTAIISTGPDAASQSSIFNALSSLEGSKSKRTLVQLSASTGTNLKALLKSIIQKATTRAEDHDEDDEGHMTTKGGSTLLNYDLEILADYVHDHGLRQVVLAFQDTEAFDSTLLSELIEVLSFWHDRIPFVFLFRIATSLESLQSRLSKDAVKCMQGRLFDVATSAEAVEHILEAITDSETLLWIGPGLLSTIVERQNDYIHNTDTLVDALQYALMSNYYANALSIFLDPYVQYKDVPSDHFEAVRHLDSFRTFCEQLLEKKQALRLKDLLEEDEILFGTVRSMVEQGRKALADLVVAVDVVRELQKHLPQQQRAPKSKLYIQALSHKLQDSSQVRSMLLSVRKAPSSTVMHIMDAILALKIPGDIHDRCAEVQKSLTELLGSSDTKQPLRSEDDVKNSTLRTTVVAQKVELSRQKSSLSKQDEAYTAILRRFTDLLEAYFRDTLIAPTDLVFHEIFLYDLKSPHREAFTPRPRHAVERALAAPHDYLDCDCCKPEVGEGDESTLAACQPATAVLYQLYLESGSLINASDLWQAFRAVLGEEQDEGQKQALFQRSLAELDYLGMVKSTRKRVDHVAKVAWKGL